MIIRSPKEINDFLKRHKTDLDMPHTYLGKEPNTFHRDWKGKKLKVLLAALWRYEDFRGNQTVPLLYQMLNEWRKDIIVERAHFPSTEREYKLFKNYQIPLFSLESKRAAGEFDIIATSLSFLPPWVNFPLMLKMSGISALRKDRDPERKKPLTLVGGSAMYGNFCIAYPVVDMIYVGDAEVGLFDLLTMWMNVRHHDLTIDEGVQIAQKDFNFIFCPSLYRPVYDKKKFVEWRPKHRTSVGKPVYPVTIKRATCRDLDKAPMYTRPLPSYTDTTMGLGEVEISRGCRGVCVFCGIGWKYRPYRERSKDVMVKALTENRREGGGTSLCPIATEFAFYSEKRGLVNELAKHSRFVDPLSMRIDAFASDAEFDRFLGKRGMNQLALGVEAVSQRLRNRLMKGITEEQIKKACRIAIGSGTFRRIKFFMISNIDENKKDFQEFFDLLWYIRTKIPKGDKIRIKASWTPLFVEPCTPFQWKKPTIEQRQDWKWVDEELRKLNVGFALGIKNEENFLWMMQGMHLGDTRFAEAVARASEKLERPFYVAFSRKTKETVSQFLKETGGSWDYIMRERGETEKFPWDVIDREVPKKSLLNIYKKVSSGEMDMKKTTIVCKSDDAVLADDRELCQEQIAEKWYIFKYYVDKDFETVPNSHWRAQIHRAAWKAKVPLATNQLYFFSDRDNRNWYGGIDHFGAGMRRKLTAGDKERVIENMNMHLIGMRLGACTGIPKKDLTWKSFVGRYTVSTDINGEHLKKLFYDFMNADEVLVNIPKTRYFSGVRKKKVDVRKAIETFSFEGLRDGNLDIFLEESEAEIRYLLKGMLTGVSFKRILSYPILKTELFVRTRAGLQEVFRVRAVGNSVPSEKV